MNEKQQRILQELENAGWIAPCRNAPFRISREKSSLQRCIRRPDYLGRYDTAVRYCFLWLLEKGYDIHPMKVHPVFRFMLHHLGEISYDAVQDIIQNRHSAKYKGVEVSEEVCRALKKATESLKNIVQFH